MLNLTTTFLPLPSLPRFPKSRSSSQHSLICTLSQPVSHSRVISWNVNSLRRLLRHNPRALHDLVETYDPDVLCLQSTHIHPSHETLFETHLPSYEFNILSCSSSRLGPRGTAIYSRADNDLYQIDLRDDPCLNEGGYVEARFQAIVVANVYSGRVSEKKRDLWDSAWRQQVRQLRFMNGYPVMVVGHLGEARQSLEDTVETCGLVDIRERLGRNEEENEKGKRDYVFVTDDMVDAVKGIKLLKDVKGSDNYPICVDLVRGLI